jgi:DNA-binding protein H-NS
MAATICIDGFSSDPVVEPVTLPKYEVNEVSRPVRSIVRLFERLPFEEQKEALQHLQAAHETSRSAKRAELERQLAELGYAPRKPVRAKALTKANGAAQQKPKRAAKKNGKATSAKAKYRDGKTGETWSGRGRMARWLKAKQDAGENIEKYLLN